MNIVGETAHFCPYADFHLLTAHGDTVTDRGPSPVRSAHHLLTDGPNTAFLMGATSGYDVITALVPGSLTIGAQRRLVLPDGMEITNLKIICRGGSLHAFQRQRWFQITVSEILFGTPR